MPSSYTLGEHFERFIQQKVKSGRYGSASEVLREGLRLLEDKDALREQQIKQTKALIAQGRLSGKGLKAADVFDKLEKKYKRQQGLN